MASAQSTRQAGSAVTEATPTATAVRPPQPVKMVISGGFGVGKTTAIGAVSEIEPLTTEAAITEVAAGVDDTTMTPRKTTTTVAMDFGCLTLDPTLKLYIFGTPGQDRFGFMWKDVTAGALGALVVVDSRRLDECFPAVDYFERDGTPFAIAVNAFDGVLSHSLPAVRSALDVAPEVPVVAFDARSGDSVRESLIVVLEHALTRARGY